MKNKIILFLIFSTIFISCEKEFKINQQKNKKINLICFLKANDTIRARISYTTLSYLNDYSDYITNAEIFLYENGLFMEKLIYDTLYDRYGFWGYYKSKSFIPNANNFYQIKVLVNGFDTIYSQTFLNEPIMIDSIKIKYKCYINPYDETDTTVDFSIPVFISDNNLVKNYFNLETNFHFKIKNPIIETRDNNGIYYSDAIHGKDAAKAIFTDSLFKNSKTSIIINFSKYLNELNNNKFIFELQTLSKDAYLYFKTTYLYGKTFEKPLTEPVQIYSNVKNGTGIFAGYSSYTDTLVITKEMLNFK